MEFKFDLLEKENVGTIELGDKVRVSDPCYDMDTWCAGTLENVLSGIYQCFYQKVDTGDWGNRVASIEVRHENYLNIDSTELQNIDVGVDSGQAGIYDLDYFAKNREDKDGEDAWYDKICDTTYKYIKNPDYVTFEESPYWKNKFAELEKEFGYIHNSSDLLKILTRLYQALDELKDDDIYEVVKNNVLNIEYCEAKEKYSKSKIRHEYIYDNTPETVDDKCLVSCSGDGDGSYTCLVGRNAEGKIVSIKIDYYYGYEDEEEDEEE